MLGAWIDSGLSQKIDVLIISILAVILFFTPLAGGTEKGVSVWIVHVMVFMLLLLWILETLSKKRVSFVRTCLDYPILFFALLSIISATFSISRLESFRTLLNFFDYIVIYYIVVNKIKNQKQIALFIYTIIASGSLVALLGILKYLKTSANTLWFTYYNPNPLGAYLGMLVPLAVIMMMSTQDLGKKILIGYSICMLIIGFTLTLSRAGWFSLLCALLLVGYLYQKKFGHHGWSFIPILLMVGIVLLCIAILGYVNVKHEVFSLNKKRIKSVSHRVPIWKGTLDIIHTYPMLGAGPGTFPLLCHDYIEKYFGGPLRDKYAHSEYLQTVAEWGIFSLIIIFWIQTRFFVEVFKMYLRSSRTNFYQYLRLGIIGSTAAVSIHSLTEFALHPMANAILCVVLGGLAMGKGLTSNKGRPSKQATITNKWGKNL